MKKKMLKLFTISLSLLIVLVAFTDISDTDEPDLRGQNVTIQLCV